MKHIIIMVLLLAGTIRTQAQGVDASLRTLMGDNARHVARVKAQKDGAERDRIDTLSIQERYNVRFHCDGSIRELCILGTLTDEAMCPTEELSALGIKVVCTVGKIVIMDVPAEAYDRLTQLSAFRWLAPDRVHQLDNDIARVTNTVAWAAQELPEFWPSPFQTKYDGTGVVVGVIDQGIDFNHIAFLDREGKTRIKKAITFTSKSDEPIITTGDSIGSLTAGNKASSHGTHTSTTAAGSNAGGLNLQGMAPGADLVLCDCSNSLSDSHLMVSAQEIFKYATEQNKPAVINFSIGDVIGFHDGSNPVARAFKTLTSEQSGRIISISSSNSGGRMMSIRKTLNKDETIKTLLLAAYTDSTGHAAYTNAIDAYVYSTDGNSFSVELKAVDITTGTAYSLSEKPMKKGEAIWTPTQGVEENADNNKYYYEAVIDTAYKFVDANIHLGIEVTAGADNQTIVIAERSASKNKAYLVGEEENPKLTGYTSGSSDMSHNIMASTDGVISVGSYMDRRGWRSIDGHGYYTPVYNKYKIYSMAPYSSYGLNDDGETSVPDVVTTGTYIVSAYNAYDNTNFEGSDINSRTIMDSRKPYITHMLQGEGIGNGSRPYFYGAMSGTSMAAPMATGIIALWLQAKPDLTTAQVRDLIRRSSVQDVYTCLTDSMPSNNALQVGMGKMDALRGLEILYNDAHPTETIAMDETITMPEGRDITTFSSTSMLDFRNPNLGTKAYVASTLSDGTLTFKRVLRQVAANTGLLITAAAGSYQVPLAVTKDNIGNNYLVGTADASVALTENNGQYYVLSRQNGQTGFYQGAEGLTVPQGKAYLDLTGVALPNRVIGIALDETQISDPYDDDNAISLPEEDVLEGELIVGDKETDIDAPKTNTLNLGPIYDLSGRRVRTPRTGMYIMNGRKVIFNEN